MPVAYSCIVGLPFQHMVWIIFSGPFGSLSSFIDVLKIVLINPVLESMAGVAHFISDHEQTQLN